MRIFEEAPGGGGGDLTTLCIALWRVLTTMNVGSFLVAAEQHCPFPALCLALVSTQTGDACNLVMPHKTRAR